MQLIHRLDVFLASRSKTVTWWLAGFVFLLLLAGLRHALRQPPVWDGAMSVYPAAIELAKTGFDLPRLLSLPTYLEGGPNTHSTSPWTLLAAAAIAAGGSLESALGLLHVLSFALAALTAAATYRLISHFAPGLVAVTGAVAALTFPPMIVQASDIYLDLPVACLGIWSIVFLLEHRYGLSSGLIVLATAIKPLGVIFVPVLAMHELSYTPKTHRMRRVLLLTLPPIVALSAVALLERQAPPSQDVATRTLGTIYSTGQLLSALPDVIGLIAVVLALAIASTRRRALGELLRIAIWLLTAAYAFVLFNPLVTPGIPLLPRYYVMIVPVVVAAIVGDLAVRHQKLAQACAFALLVGFSINLGGLYYPYKEHATFAIAERSLAYRDLLELQIEGVARLVDIGQDQPVYYDYFGFYRYTYPELGYSDRPPENGVSVFHEASLAQDGLNDMPSRFAFLYEYPVLGGNILRRLWDEAKNSEEVILRVQSLSRGTFTIYVVEVARKDASGTSLGS